MIISKNYNTRFEDPSETYIIKLLATNRISTNDLLWNISNLNKNNHQNEVYNNVKFQVS